MTLKNHIVVIAYSLGLLLLLLIYIAANQYDIEYKVLTGDPAYVNSSNPFVGALSNIGIVLWSVTASICLFASRVLKQRGAHTNARFLLAFGLLTTLLLLDDLFMLHDYIFSKYFGISQVITYGVYGILTLIFLYQFRAQILSNNNMILLLLAFLFFGSSISLDLFVQETNLKYFLEDALKFLGIVGWLVYFTNLSIQKITQNS